MQSSEARRAADPRPARTRAAIYGAVEALAAGIGTEVSVNAIVRIAGVSRSAFYAQFADLDDLAVEMLVDAFRNIGTDDVADRVTPGAAPHASAHRSLGRLVEHVGARHGFYRASLDWRLSSRAHETVVGAFAGQVLATMEALGGDVPADVNQEDAARFIAGGAVAMLTAWLREEAPGRQAELVERLLALMPAWLVGTERR